MAATSTVYSGDGVTRDFLIGFTYTSRSFVKAYVGGVLTGAWTFLNATTIRFTVAPASGTNNVEIRRVTSTTPLVDFVGAATITDTDLDLAIDQCLDLLEENQNNSIVGMQQTGGNWDATSDRIINVAAPLASTDGANKAYVDAVVGSASDAADSAAEAALSAAEALTQAGNALASATAADASADAAAASAASINSVLPVSGMTTNQIPVVSGATAYTNRRLKHMRYISGGSAAGASLSLALSGYNEYVLELTDFAPATDGVLRAHFATDGVPTYITSNYAYSLHEMVSNLAAVSGSGTDSGANMVLASNVESARISRICSVNIFMGDGGSFRNTIEGYAVVQDPGSGGAAGTRIAHTQFAAEYHGATNAATHIRLIFSSGNIANGSYILWGVVS